MPKSLLRKARLRYQLVLQAVAWGPAAAVGLWRFKTFYARLMTRFEVSRRFIRSEMFAGITFIESIDMTQVLDVSIVKYGPVADVVVLSRDKTTPKLKMEYVDAGAAQAAAAFIMANGINTWTELAVSRRRPSKPEASVPVPDADPASGGDGGGDDSSG